MKEIDYGTLQSAGISPDQYLPPLPVNLLTYPEVQDLKKVSKLGATATLTNQAAGISLHAIPTGGEVVFFITNTPPEEPKANQEPVINLKGLCTEIVKNPERFEEVLGIIVTIRQKLGIFFGLPYHFLLKDQAEIRDTFGSLPTLASKNGSTTPEERLKLAEKLQEFNTLARRTAALSEILNIR